MEVIKTENQGSRGRALTVAPSSVTFFPKIVGSLASGLQTPWQLFGASEINSEEDQGLQGGR